MPLSYELSKSMDNLERLIPGARVRHVRRGVGVIVAYGNGLRTAVLGRFDVSRPARYLVRFPDGTTRACWWSDLEFYEPVKVTVVKPAKTVARRRRGL